MLNPIVLGGAPALVAIPEGGGVAGCVLLYHGLGAEKALHEGELDLLANAGFVAVALDAVGHGDRRDAERRARKHGGTAHDLFLELVAETADEVPAVVDDLVRRGWAEPGRVGLVGISMGGFVAYGAALRDRRIAAIVTVTASPRWGAREDSPHLRPEVFHPVAILSVVAGADDVVPPGPVRAFHRAVEPYYAATPERLRLLEHAGARHWMPEHWPETALEGVAWLGRFLAPGASAGDVAREER